MLDGERKWVIYRSDGKLKRMLGSAYDQWERRMRQEYSEEGWRRLQAKYPKVADGLTDVQADRFIDLANGQEENEDV